MIVRMMWQGVVLAVVAAAAAIATWHWDPERPQPYLTAEAAGPDEVTVAEALALANDKDRGVVWIDARRRSVFEQGHIPGALLLNEEEWTDLMVPVVELLGQTDPRTVIVIYCDGKKCEASHNLRERILRFGVAEFDIRVLHGGWPAWKAAGGAVELSK
jgi:rhodanese-related sulfurtransferase